jgi:hypothetical protein
MANKEMAIAIHDPEKYTITVVYDDGDSHFEFRYDTAVGAVHAYDKFVDCGDAKKKSVVTLVEKCGTISTKTLKRDKEK